jgi:hypothetical protein
MRTLTANVFITKSLPAIDKLFFADHRIESFQEQLKTLSKSEFEDSFIASPMRNDGLMHFEYSFQVNGNANQGKGSTVVIRLQETSKLLEMFLLENDPLSRVIDTRNEKIEKILRSSKADKLLENPFSKVNFNEKLKRSSRFYMAFGTGDKIKEWSGPYSMQLAGATLVNDSNNTRAIEVTFVADTDSFRSYSDKLGKLMGYNDDLQNLSQFVTDSMDLEAKAVMKIRDCNNKKFNLDYRVRKIIKEYIGSFTGNDNNAVVVFPQQFGSVTPTPLTQSEIALNKKLVFLQTQVYYMCLLHYPIQTPLDNLYSYLHENQQPSVECNLLHQPHS